MNSNPRGSLFTVVMEFDGTTSVSQFVATSVKNALKLWRKGLDQPIVYDLSPSSAQSFKVAYDKRDPDRAPVPINGVAGVWCTTVVVGNRLALLNIVKTRRS